MRDNATRTRKRSPYALPVAGVFIVLCIVGFVTILLFCFNVTKDLLDSTAKKLEYERMLLPVVMFDPVPFEGAENFDRLAMLQTCVWATLLGENRDVYSYDDFGQLVVPAIDVDVTAQKLFGSGAKLEHQTFGTYEDTYVYDESIKSYLVPITTMTGFYTPKVNEISRKGDVITLKVGYVPPSTALNISFGKEDNSPVADKVMIYELHKAKTGYFIYAIRDIEGASLVPGVSISMPLPDDLGDGSSMGEPDPDNPEFGGEGELSNGQGANSSSGSSSGASSDLAG